MVTSPGPPFGVRWTSSSSPFASMSSAPVGGGGIISGLGFFFALGWAPAPVPAVLPWCGGSTSRGWGSTGCDLHRGGTHTHAPNESSKAHFPAHTILSHNGLDGRGPFEYLPPAGHVRLQ
eukprot:8203705-Pyramimonas_sp.AAC.1